MTVDARTSLTTTLRFYRRLASQSSFLQALPAVPIMIWIGCFIVAPLAVMICYSFWRYADFNIYPDFTLKNYVTIFTTPSYWKILLRTLLIAFSTTALSVVIAYPVAYFLHLQNRTFALTMIAIICAPFWVNELVRNFAFYSIFAGGGLINSIIVGLGFEPVRLLFTLAGVLVVSVYIFLPFAVIALYSSMDKISPSLLEATADLGATKWQTFRLVVFPLSLSGLQAAVIFIFIPVLGLFVTPAMIGGGNVTMIGNLLVPILSSSLNFALGSALVVLLLSIVILLIVFAGRSLDLEQLYRGGTGRSISRRSSVRLRGWAWTIPATVILFLYTPIVLVIVFSFNQNVAAGFPLQGFTLEWYKIVFLDHLVIRALKNTLFIATATAVLSAALAAPAAYAVVRFRFIGRGLLRLLILIPIIVPQLLLALGILVLVSALGLPLSSMTIIIGHVTYALPFVFFLLLAQQYGIERTVEEAAADLGASGWTTFWRVTFPLMRTGVLTGGLIAFSLSMNDFVMAFLLTGTTSVLPVYMWGMLRGPVTPVVNAISAVLVGITLGIAILAIVWRTLTIDVKKIRPEQLKAS